MSTALTATNYKELTTAISANVRQLKESVPDVMTSFNACPT